VVAIEAGDSLWKLSRRYLGSGVYWRKWLASNPDLGDPHRLQPGARLVVPETAKGRSGDRPVPVISGHTQTVVARAGDSLWKIAAARYAHGAYWPCVAQANAPLPGKEMIYAGQVLLLPASCENPRRSAPSVAP
jgi:nucleoid-associated protein YgaU